ncbi:hypothetical protein AURDEDRAFT_117618 [Auricularia subglabra TFB-10046 SS5]|uniref:C3H1-type domain-containing protein n=1 Tax=Auricularia subglabra (strain TFB-10046 / SS5) TaxID=717982 RepID=J0LDC6_AURST|nr:hypothetical protein AURDEDRAFT_117618 [Auricularia subglabra TFB-10046 SS5]
MGDEENTAVSSGRWQDLVGELSSLYSHAQQRSVRLDQVQQELVVTQVQNEELEKRVRELEREVQVWRQAHERECIDKDAVEVAKQALEQEMQSLKDDAPLIVCLIDGDGTIFASDYIMNGQQGGRAAAQALHRGMLEYLAPHGTRAAVCATVYCNRSGLRDTLVRTGTCTSQQFDAFWIGFVQAASMFCLVDVGPGKEAADAKLREALRIYARMPQVMRIFFGGAHDGGYRPPLSALQTEGHLDKVVLIKTQDDIALDLRTLNLSTVIWNGLFMPQKLQIPGNANGNGARGTAGGATPRPQPHMNLPLGATPRMPNVNLPPEDSPRPDPPPGKRYPDPKIPLGRHVPPPCNFFYLISMCPQGTKCPYGHNFILNPDQMAALRKAAKKAPCYIVNRNQKCPYGERCCMSHKCPRATNCPYIKAGKCKWTGNFMHDQPAASPAAASGSGSG